MWYLWIDATKMQQEMAGNGERRGRSECGRELWRLGLFYAMKDGRWRVEGGGCGLGTPGRSFASSLPFLSRLCLCMGLHGCLTSIAGSNLRKISHWLLALGTWKPRRHLEDAGHNSKMLKEEVNATLTISVKTYIIIVGENRKEKHAVCVYCIGVNANCNSVKIRRHHGLSYTIPSLNWLSSFRVFFHVKQCFFNHVRKFSTLLSLDPLS